MKRSGIFAVVGIVIAMTVLYGCGGGSSTPTGRATFTVHWPPRTRLIPMASNSIKVTITDSNNNVISSQILTRPFNGGMTTANFNNLPPGNLTATAVAYPNSDGTGTAQAMASAPLAIQINQNTAITITMVSTIDHINVSAASSNVIVSQGDQLMATPVDSMGNIVLISAAEVVWKSANTGIVTVQVDNSNPTLAIATGVSTGSTQITFTDNESGKSGSVTLTVGLGTNGGLQPGSPWPKFHNTIRNTGLATAFGAGSSLKWNPFQTVGEIWGSPTIAADGTVYIASWNTTSNPGAGALYALNGSTGALKWQFTLPQKCSSAPAIAVDGTLYLGDADGNLYAITDSGSSATLKWKYQTGNIISGSATIGADGTIFFASYDSKVYALKDNGSGASLVWKHATGGSISSTPALSSDGTLLYVGSFDQNVYALSTVTGSQVWSFPTGSLVDNSPAVGMDGTVYVGSSDGNLYALNGTTGAEKWAYSAGGEIHSSPAIGADGTIYFGANTTKLYAILDGGSQANVRWIFQALDNISSSPAVASDGTVYVGDLSGNILAINPGGTQKWTYPTGLSLPSSPAIGLDGTVYIGARNAMFYAFH